MFIGRGAQHDQPPKSLNYPDPPPRSVHVAGLPPPRVALLVQRCTFTKAYKYRGAKKVAIPFFTKAYNYRGAKQCKKGGDSVFLQSL